MRNNTNILFVGIIIFILFANFTSFISDNNNGNQLFKIERSRDKDVIIYNINLDKDGYPSKLNPFEIYWVKKSSDNKKAPLTWVQRNFSYGLRILNYETNKTDNSLNVIIDFQFVSYNKRTLTLKKDNQGIYKVYMKISDKEIELNNIYIQIDGGSFWVPNISKVELLGVDIQNKSKVTEIIYP